MHRIVLQVLMDVSCTFSPTRPCGGLLA